MRTDDASIGKWTLFMRCCIIPSTASAMPPTSGGSCRGYRSSGDPQVPPLRLKPSVGMTNLWGTRDAGLKPRSSRTRRVSATIGGLRLALKRSLRMTHCGLTPPPPRMTERYFGASPKLAAVSPSCTSITNSNPNIHWNASKKDNSTGAWKRCASARTRPHSPTTNFLR